MKKTILFLLLIVNNNINAQNEAIYTYKNNLYLPSVIIKNNPNTGYAVEMKEQGDGRFILTKITEKNITNNENISIYDPNTSSLNIPKVILNGDSSGITYNANLIAENNNEFRLIQVRKIMPQASPIPINPQPINLQPIATTSNPNTICADNYPKGACDIIRNMGLGGQFALGTSCRNAFPQYTAVQLLSVSKCNSRFPGTCGSCIVDASSLSRKSNKTLNLEWLYDAFIQLE